MIQALLNTLGKQDLVAEANKMFVTESRKLFHVRYYFFFIAKLALYEVLNLCWRPKLFKFIWVLFLNVRVFPMFLAAVIDWPLTWRLQKRKGCSTWKRQS